MNRERDPFPISLGALAALASLGGFSFGGGRSIHEPNPDLKCVNCGGPRRGVSGNCFCSADCCREYKAKQRRTP